MKASPGGRPPELSEAMGARPTRVSLLIAKACSENRVKRSDGCALQR